MRAISSAIVFLACFSSSLGLAASHSVPPRRSLWSQLAELTPSERQNQDWFGISVAISGDVAVVGAFDSNIEATGKAYVFVKSGQWGNMTQTATLTPSDGGEGFGTSVAISGDTIVIGAANASNFETPAQAQGPGAAYVFVKPPSRWADMTETAKLTASDGAAGDAFGYNVSISGNTAAVGALFAHGGAGAAYVFVMPQAGWSNMTETAELSASDATPFDNMGSVAISGNTVLTGAYGHNNFSGAAYIFVEPQSGWQDMTQTAEFINKKPNQIYGFSVAIDGNTALVGAVGAHQGVGAAYVYVEPPSGWTNTAKATAKLSAPLTSGISGLSQGMSINDGMVALGAPSTTVGSNSGQGAVLVYSMPQAGWKTTNHFAAKLTASDGAANDGLGVSASVNNGIVIGGAPKSGPPGEAYVFAQSQ